MKRAKSVRAAIVQSRPNLESLDASLETLERMAREAAGQGAELIALGETAIPGYPAWLDACPSVAIWDHEPAKRARQALYEHCVAVPSPAFDRLCALARECSATLIVGVQERVDSGPGNGSIYNALLTIDADGRLLNHHRKLVPTYTEKLLWAYGDTAGLRSVETRSRTEEAYRVGSLVCWEHWMPLARQAMHDGGEHVHAAVWPTVHDRHVVASRHYAFEGRCFVLAAGQVQAASDLPSELDRLPEHVEQPDTLVNRGGSCIIAPNGEIIEGPLWDETGVLIADLDLGMCDRERMTLDVSGHYARPDAFRFEVLPNPRPAGEG
ncbi:MAG: carbon-nitrogen hydrolase family protein [Planctomycetota bacterium]